MDYYEDKIPKEAKAWIEATEQVEREAKEAKIAAKKAGATAKVAEKGAKSRAKVETALKKAEIAREKKENKKQGLGIYYSQKLKEYYKIAREIGMLKVERATDKIYFVMDVSEFKELKKHTKLIEERFKKYTKLKKEYLEKEKCVEELELMFKKLFNKKKGNGDSCSKDIGHRMVRKKWSLKKIKSDTLSKCLQVAGIIKDFKGTNIIDIK